MILTASPVKCLTYWEERSLDRCLLPGIGHIVGRSPTRDEYRASIQAVWNSDDPTDEEIEIAQRLERLVTVLDWTPKHLKGDR